MNRYQDIESELNKMRKKTFVTVELPVIERSPQDRFIFTNSNGSTRASAGFYKVGTDVLTVDSNGVVTNKASC